MPHLAVDSLTLFGRRPSGLEVVTSLGLLALQPGHCFVVGRIQEPHGLQCQVSIGPVLDVGSGVLLWFRPDGTPAFVFLPWSGWPFLHTTLRCPGLPHPVH